jgi:hypothetical protein
LTLFFLVDDSIKTLSESEVVETGTEFPMFRTLPCLSIRNSNSVFCNFYIERELEEKRGAVSWINALKERRLNFFTQPSSGGRS